jgi:primosomal protein N'
MPAKVETVEMVASGYEWTCPNCGKLNHASMATDQVECHWCNYVFPAREAN